MAEPSKPSVVKRFFIGCLAVFAGIWLIQQALSLLASIWWQLLIVALIILAVAGLVWWRKRQQW